MNTKQTLIVVLVLVVIIAAILLLTGDKNETVDNGNATTTDMIDGDTNGGDMVGTSTATTSTTTSTSVDASGSIQVQ